MLFGSYALPHPLLALGNVNKPLADLFVFVDHISNLPKGKKYYSYKQKMQLTLHYIKNIYKLIFGLLLLIIIIILLFFEFTKTDLSKSCTALCACHYRLDFRHKQMNAKVHK